MTSASDGLFEWRGKAGQVRVGHVVQGARRTKNDVWEILEMKHPAQFEYGCTLWWRVVNKATGQVAAVPPKSITAPVTFLLSEEEFEMAEKTRRPPDLPHQWPVDSDEVLLLAEKLGARDMASRDNETGEITCPSYAAGQRHTPVWRPGILMVDEIEHLKICHGLDVGGLEAISDPNELLLAVAKEHGALHGPRSSAMAHKGFPHRHTPEDRTIL